MSEDEASTSAGPGSRTWWALAALGLAAAAWVAMTEVGSIVAEATPTGGTSLSALFGFARLTGFADLTPTVQALQAWSGPANPLNQYPAPQDLYFWLFSYLGFDLLFLIGYGLFGLALLRPARNSQSRREPALWLLLMLLTAHFLQDAIAAEIFRVIRQPWVSTDPLVVLLHAATVAKWLLAVALLTRVAYLAWDVDKDRHAIRSVVSALWVQRYSVVLVALVTVIAAGHGSDILQQLPDVPRAWLTRDGWEPAVVAMLAEALLALLLVFLGRMRTRHAIDKYDQGKNLAGPAYLPWLLVPAGLVVVAVILWQAGLVELGWWRLGAAAAVPIFIGASSLVIGYTVKRIAKPELVLELRKLWQRLARRGTTATATETAAASQQEASPSQPEPSKADEQSQVAVVRTAGDALAVAAVAVPGLGLVRSFTAPALLAGTWYATASWVAVGIGIVFATLSWPAANGLGRKALRALATSGPGLIRGFFNGARQGPLRQGVWANTWPWLLGGMPYLAAVVWLLFWPLSAAHRLGVLGTIVIALGTLTITLAVLAYLAQVRQPVPLFQVLRLGYTPVLSVIVAVGIAGGLVDARSLVHLARGPVTTASQAQAIAQTRWELPGNTLLGSLARWETDTKDANCARPVGNGSVRVQPLIMVAAAGGGIRAAWWAEQAMSMFASTECGRHDVFAVSSVSGGSVGMAVLASAPANADGNPKPQADADIRTIAGPDALAAGLDGLLLHDLVAGFTGVDLPVVQRPDGHQFDDRAGLIESTWSNEDPRLKLPYPLQDSPLPWRLLFNSTTVASGCRAVIANSALPESAQAAGSSVQSATPASSSPLSPVTCDLQTSVAGGGSYDFFARLGCQRGIATVTAAMLSARFPYVTPSGVVTGCDSSGKPTSSPVGQFVDGGYVDSSGLFTLADLIPAITSQLRAANARALAQAQRSGQPTTVFMPLVMYLGNSARPAVAPVPVPPLAQEGDLPLSAKSAASGNLGTSDTLFQRIGSMIGAGEWLACPSASSPADKAAAACTAAQREADKAIPDQLFMVAPSVAPQVAAPLGWVLSPASQQSLDNALDREASYQCTIPGGNKPGNNGDQCTLEPGIGRLGDILALVKPS